MPKTSFGQLVIGPPGSGKTTYCHGIQQFYKQIGRSAVVINLDPANDVLPYDCSIDISELITVNDVMDGLLLGPNGALVYCMEFLESNFLWLESKLEQFEGSYFLIDCPGQVELNTHHDAIKNIVERLEKLNVRLTAVHLVDSHYCVDVSKFLSVTLTSLITMLQISLPAVNILSKIDLIEMDEKLHFNLDYYTEILDLKYLLDIMPEDPFMRKHKKLNEILADVVQNYSLVKFVPLNIQDKESVMEVIKVVDRCNGYVFGNDEERNISNLLTSVTGAEFTSTNIQEKYLDNSSDEINETMAKLK